MCIAKEIKDVGSIGLAQQISMIPRAYRLKKRACNCTPSKIQTVPKIVTVSTVSIGAKPAKVSKCSINYNRIIEFC